MIVRSVMKGACFLPALSVFALISVTVRKFNFNILEATDAPSVTDIEFLKKS